MEPKHRKQTHYMEFVGEVNSPLRLDDNPCMTRNPWLGTKEEVHGTFRHVQNDLHCYYKHIIMSLLFCRTPVEIQRYYRIDLCLSAVQRLAAMVYIIVGGY